MRSMVILALIPAFTAIAASAGLPTEAPALLSVAPDTSVAGAKEVGAKAGVFELTAEQLIEKNVAARGGAEAWRKIDTMIWTGHMQSEHAPVPVMTFVMEQKRPNKTRFEIDAMGQKTLRLFDGAHGWKLKPNREGGPDAKPYTPQEVTFAFRAQAIDGPLIDYQAKGNVATLEGIDEVEGHKAFRLKVQLASGETDHVWIDAHTFLDVKYERPSYGPPGTPSTVSIFYRDYKVVEGLAIPAVIETASAPGKTPDRMVIDRVALNPPLDDRIFTKEGVQRRRNGIASGAQSGGTVGRIPGMPPAPQTQGAAPRVQASPPEQAAPALQTVPPPADSGSGPK